MLASLLLIALQSPAPAAAPAQDASAVTAAPAPSKATEKLIELRALLDDNQCEKVVALSPYVEDHRHATQAERHEAMFARAYCLISSLGNIAEAGTVFQEILEEDIKANPPFDVEPKFQFLVDGARANLSQAKRTKAEAEHAKKVARIDYQISGAPQVKGGNRVFFDVTLTDPDGVVRSMRVDFRKKGAREYYALPVAKRADGRWRGEVPGTYTRSSTGMTLEWFLTLSDEEGEPLKTAGTRDKPFALEVLPGSAIAEDLHANERAPQPTRFIAGLAVTPFFTFVGVAGGLLVSVGADTLVLLIPNADGVGNVIGGFLLMTMPLAMGAGMVFLLESAILDAPQSWIATGIVAAFLVVAEVCLAIDAVERTRWVSHEVARAIGPGDTGGPPNVGGSTPVLIAGTFVVMGALAGAIATPILVGIDAPEE